MVFIRRLGKEISGNIWLQDKIWLRVEVDDIEGGGAYCRSQFKGGTDLIPPPLHRGVQGQARSMGEPIGGQGGMKK